MHLPRELSMRMRTEYTIEYSRKEHLWKRLEETPQKENEYDQSDPRKWPILFIISCIFFGPMKLREHGTLTCFKSNSQLMRTAAFLYFWLSSLKRPDSSPIRSKLSPRYNKSSMFFVMTFVTSLSSSFTRSRFCDARLSWYNFLVR